MSFLQDEIVTTKVLWWIFLMGTVIGRAYRIGSEKTIF
jgi:hypothetical protein